MPHGMPPGRPSFSPFAQGGDLFTITRCPTCPNAVIDTARVEQLMRRVLCEHDFNVRLQKRLRTERPLHHQLLHLAVAGCPNSCSQPQIKDFAVQGRAVPEVGEGCLACGECTAACPEGAVTLVADAGPRIDREKCLSCGRCARACPAGALVAGRRGYRVLAGGRLGRHPALAVEVFPLAGEDELVRLLGAAVELFLTECRSGERFGAMLERVGVSALTGAAQARS